MKLQRAQPWQRWMQRVALFIDHEPMELVAQSLSDPVTPHSIRVRYVAGDTWQLTSMSHLTGTRQLTGMLPIGKMLPTGMLRAGNGNACKKPCDP